MKTLNQRRILLGISGGIAAYKSAELTRLLIKAGAEVRVVMTDAACEFIRPLTLQALSGHPVHQHLLDPEAEAGMGHIELARWAELILIAPASANLIARLCHGFADDLLTTLCLASHAPVLLAPAMNQAMWRHPQTQTNVAQLQQRGVQILGPDSGEQACGDLGPGRMLEPEALVAAIRPPEQNCATATSLRGRKVMITAGPTREALDPVRYISNHSSGKMGYALAQAALEAGAEVHLVSGPVHLPTPAGVVYHPVESAEEMLAACLAQLKGCDLFIGAAAVADYRPVAVAEQKLKKGAEELMELRLIKNPDIIAQVAAQTPKPFTVGFAAETQNLLAYARSKLARKGLDMIIANDVSAPGIGFNSDENAVTLITADSETHFATQSKSILAKTLIEYIAAQLPSPSIKS